MPSREQRLLDAAIDVLGTGGMRQLTHRAVDACAGLAEGSTSNRFRTREALLIGVLRRILERETAVWSGLDLDLQPTSIETFVILISRQLTALSSQGRVLSQARRAVFVEAGFQPVLGDEIVRAQSELASWLAPLLEHLGSADPPSHVRYLLALMDGLLDHQLARPAPEFDPATAVAALLHGLLGR